MSDIKTYDKQSQIVLVVSNIREIKISYDI